MSQSTTDEDLRHTLRKLASYSALGVLAECVDLSRRTLYRQAEDSPPPMSGTTRAELTRIFVDLGLVGDYDVAALMEALRRLKSGGPSQAGEIDGVLDLDDARRWGNGEAARRRGSPGEG
jgi:hypothetical protein